MAAIGRLAGFVWLAACLPVSAAGYPAASPPHVLTSIQPLALILREAFADTITVETLFPPAVSPHSQALRPGDLARLQSAQLVVWVGPELETSLAKVLDAGSGRGVSGDAGGASSPHRMVLGLVEALQRVPAGQGSRLHGLASDAQAGDHGHEHDSPARKHGMADGETGKEADHSHPIDPHIWMDSQLALEIARLAAQRIGMIRPDLIPELDRGLADFSVLIAGLDHTPLPDVLPIVAYHPSFGYLARQLEVTIAAYVKLQTEAPLRTQSFVQMQMRLQRDPSCLVLEPQFAGTGVAERLRDAAAHVRMLDPMAGSSQVYTHAWKTWRQVLESCATGRAAAVDTSAASPIN